MIGQRVGTRTVERVENDRVFYLCDCGRRASCSLAHFLDKRSQNAACRWCAMKEASKIRVTHGQTVGRTRGAKRTVEYAAWESMKQRCTDANCVGYKDYGARGISVSPEWLGEVGFARFLAHVGPRPSRAHSLDRVNNGGNYEPGNVRWATKKEQQRNRRSNKLLTVAGETLCVAEWAERLGCSPSVIHDRLEDGWGATRAATEPVKQYRPRKVE